MVPVFGFLRAERTALVGYTLSGVAGLILFLTGISDRIAIAAVGEPWPERYVENPGFVWVTVQGGLVVFSGLLPVSFVLVLVGALAGLVLVTPIGFMTFPWALYVLILALRRPGAFVEFRSRSGMGPL